jgi:hypothetical protein
MQKTLKTLLSISIFLLCFCRISFAQDCPGFSIVGSPNATAITCFGDSDGTVSILVNYTPGNTLGSFIDGINGPALMQDTSIGGTTLAVANYDNLAAGTYDLIVGDASLCSDTFSFTVAGPDQPFTVIVDSSRDATCGNNGLIVVATTGGWSSPSAFTWDGVDAANNQISGFPRNLGPFLSALSEGTYTATATDNRGCTASTQITLDGDVPFTVDISVLNGAIPLELGDSLDLLATPNVTNPSVEYFWFPNTDLTTLTADGDSVRVQPCSEVTYTVYALDNARQCDALDSITVTISGEFNPWLPNIFNPDSFNPANNRFKVFGTGIESVEMEIFDRKGALIYENPEGIIIGEWDGTLGNSGTKAVAGKYLYVVKIRSICGDILTRSGGISLLR